MSFLVGTPNTLSIYGATYQHSPSNPTGPTTTSQTMMGLAGSITPVLSGRIFLAIQGDVGNGTIGDGATVQLSYGTGTAPANAAAKTGTQVGSIVSFIAATAAGRSPFCLTAVITGLTLSTAYWLDLAAAQVTAGTVTLENISITAYEI